MTADSPKNHTGSGRREKNLLMMGILLLVAFSPTTALRPADFGRQYVEDPVDPSIEAPGFQGS